MTSDLVNFSLMLSFMVFLQIRTALPWVTALDPRRMERVSHIKSWLTFVVVAVFLGTGLAFYLYTSTDAIGLARWGRVYAALFHLSLGANLLVWIFAVLLRFWPKGGAVAQAAFREGIRQPMFWLLLSILSLIMLISPFIPYYTFGEDLKTLKDLCFAFTMMASALFGVVSASLSVTEEIEGRTAITLLSKPISRRQFLIGKFLGIFFASSALVMMLGWLTVWVVLLKQAVDPPLTNDAPVDPSWIVDALSPIQNQAPLFAAFYRGILLWTHDAGDVVLFLIHVLCQVMVLTAIAVTLASRLPMVVNLVCCFIIYFLGNLSNVLVDTTRNQNPLIHFVSQGIENLFPTLVLFDVTTAVVRDLPLPLGLYAWHTFLVFVFALLQTTIALLIGLILFEDRDLA